MYLTCDIPGPTVSFTCWTLMFETATGLIIGFLYDLEYCTYCQRIMTLILVVNKIVLLGNRKSSTQ